MPYYDEPAETELTSPHAAPERLFSEAFPDERRAPGSCAECVHSWMLTDSRTS